jgi:flagellin
MAQRSAGEQTEGRTGSEAPMVKINTNMQALLAERNLGVVQDNLSVATQRLSSGLRINVAKDDPAGLTISEKLRSQIRAIDQAGRNAQDGVSLVQTAEGALENIHAALQRIRELTVEAGNGTLNLDERNAITTEVNALIDNIDRIATTTRYDQFVIFDGSLATGLNLQVGANGGERMSIAFGDMQAQALGVDVVDESSPDAANKSLALIDAAIDAVSQQRSILGGSQNALEAIVNTLSTSSENLHASESRLRDLDVANETVEFTKLQILSQSGTAVLAQANVFPQSVLQLFR